jgi:DivIVA domain-containing protein
MSLTPADVHSITFNKPPIGKRGFDAEQVDAFLDEVERELARLIEENGELRALAGRGRPGADPRSAAEFNDLRIQLDRVQRDRAAAERAARAVEAELEQTRSQFGSVGGGQMTPVLAMAQRTADDHIASARQDADELLSTARSKAEQVASEARAKADAVERDARQRHQEAVDGLDAERNALLHDIQELARFERDYRTRLQAHMEAQLPDLDDRRPS